MANGTTIDGLNSVTSLTAQDEVPVWDKEASGEPTKKITASNLAASVKSLASLPNTTEMNAAISQSMASLHLGHLMQLTRVTITPTVSYTGVSFTLNSPAVVTIVHTYSNTAPRVISISTSSTSLNSTNIVATITQTVDASMSLTSVVNSGTYYIWASGFGTGGNDIIRRFAYL